MVGGGGPVVKRRTEWRTSLGRWRVWEEEGGGEVGGGGEGGGEEEGEEGRRRRGRRGGEKWESEEGEREDREREYNDKWSRDTGEVPYTPVPLRKKTKIKTKG